MQYRAGFLIVALGVAISSGVNAQTPVTYIKSADVMRAFDMGSPLVEVNEYKVHASRRERAGEAEIHERDTDIIYVLAGSATFVTGGTVVEARTIAPAEIRGASIRAGTTQVLGKGDVIIVPSGTPHWFKEVSGPFLYYVVKVSRVSDS